MFKKNPWPDDGRRAGLSLSACGQTQAESKQAGRRLKLPSAVRRRKHPHPAKQKRLPPLRANRRKPVREIPWLCISHGPETQRKWRPISRSKRAAICMKSRPKRPTRRTITKPRKLRKKSAMKTRPPGDGRSAGRHRSVRHHRAGIPHLVAYRPMIIGTFLESCDLTSKEIYPFTQSSSMDAGAVRQFHCVRPGRTPAALSYTTGCLQGPLIPARSTPTSLKTGLQRKRPPHASAA